MEKCVFPINWKKSNIVPVHKEDNKNLIKNYRPINLLSIFNKIFEIYFIKNNLFTKNQFGFFPGDSGISQLLSIRLMFKLKTYDKNGKLLYLMYDYLR